MQSVILHLDMNSYFASVLQQDNSEYRGKVLGVCEHLGGIIIAASVEAKRWGIKTGTPVWEAKRIYPKIILKHTTADRFRFYTRRLIKLVSEYTDKVEVYSIDEVFLDITASCNIKFPISPPDFATAKSLRAGNFPACNRLRLKQMAGRQFPNNFPISNFQTQIRNIREFIQAGKYEWKAADPWVEAVKISLEIKKRMKREVGDYMTCSIGIASNKTLAKIASDLKKPDGLVVVTANEYQKTILFERSRELSEQNLASPRGRRLNFAIFAKNDLYNYLKLTDVPGIGHRQEKNLNALGIRTLWDLKNYPKSHLIARFGRVQGHHLYSLGQLDATWKSGVHQDEKTKSMGHMYTLPKEYREAKFFIPVLCKLCEMVGRRLRRKNLEGDVIHFFIRDKNYEGFGGSEKLGDYISGGREIFMHAVRVFEKFKPKGAWEFKLIGVTVANLRPQSGQLSLFGHREKASRVSAALDKINDKYGEFTIIHTPILAADRVFRDSVGFGRIKELKRLPR